jgi:hypothetical protein
MRSGRGARGDHGAPICGLAGVRGCLEEANDSGEVVAARTVLRTKKRTR